MEKKALKYLLILLIVPLVISILIAIFSGQDGPSQTGGYDSLNGTVEYNNNTYEKNIKKSNTFIYLSVFTFVVVGAGVWIYVKKKGEI